MASIKHTKPKHQQTPVRQALLSDSALQQAVRDGLNALVAGDRDYIEEALRGDFSDSLDIDEAFQPGHEQENRWDYLLGYTVTRKVVALEPHSAKADQISKVIAKRSAALVQLSAHLKAGEHVVAWLWVASGKVHFADTESARRRLDQNGIQFVGKRLQSKHLPG
jgi:hypothetical protein